MSKMPSKKKPENPVLSDEEEAPLDQPQPLSDHPLSDVKECDLNELFEEILAGLDMGLLREELDNLPEGQRQMVVLELDSLKSLLPSGQKAPETPPHNPPQIVLEDVVAKAIQRRLKTHPGTVVPGPRTLQ